MMALIHSNTLFYMWIDNRREGDGLPELRKLVFEIAANSRPRVFGYAKEYLLNYPNARIYIS